MSEVVSERGVVESRIVTGVETVESKDTAVSIVVDSMVSRDLNHRARHHNAMGRTNKVYE
jgi:hypothetical protein